MKKYITVILTAYNRRDFLKDALNSIKNQTIDQESIQIIVIKNFLEKQIESLIKEIDGVPIIVDNCPVGVMLRKAIENSEGEIISFLDDDDLFTPNKLEVIQRCFKNDPSLIYFHNSQTKFSNLNDIPDLKAPSDVQNLCKPLIFTTGSSFVKRLTKLSPIQDWRNFFFNLSSISIRKEYYMQFLNSLERISGHTDDFFFFNALNNNSNLKMLFSHDHLTLYRVHNSTSQIYNTDSSKLKKISILDDFISTTTELANNVKNLELATILKYRLLSEIFERAMYNDDFKNDWNDFYSIKDNLIFLIRIAKITTIKSFIFIGRRCVHAQLMMRINELKRKQVS